MLKSINMVPHHVRHHVRHRHVASELTSRITDNARASAKNAFRTRVLLETNQLLQQARGIEAQARVTMSQLIKLLRCDVVFYPAENGQLGSPITQPAGTQPAAPELTSAYERAVATWAFTNNKHAGATTTTLPEARCLYLAVRTGNEVYGVVGLALAGRSLEAFENSIVLSIVGEAALALQSERAAQEREQAAVVAKNEQLRANLLRSIGHDLRTPLTSISGAAGSPARRRRPARRREAPRACRRNLRRLALADRHGREPAGRHAH